MALRPKRKSDSTGRIGKEMSRIEQVQVLMNAFRMERIVYIILTTVSAISLIISGVYFSFKGGDMSTLLVLLAPTGALTLCIFRVLKMWDDALKFITDANSDDDEQ
ncbi:MAG TPA: hypothetical protein VK151_16540 [Fluviicola sp.]|nr:hypothetical protein [Fluviicola sp.]